MNSHHMPINCAFCGKEVVAREIDGKAVARSRELRKQISGLGRAPNLGVAWSALLPNGRNEAVPSL